MSENAKENGNSTQQGFYIRGTYLGVEEGREWTPPGTTEVRTIKPKLGLMVNGEEVAVSAKDDGHLAQARSGLIKGDEVEILVEVRPPYGSRGDVGFFLPGAIESRRTSWK